jgi:adenylate kinase
LKPVIYLTGAPATGKSTLSRNLKLAVPQLVVFAYSEKLREHVAAKNSRGKISESEIREKSSAIVTPEDIEQLDAKLIELVQTERLRQPVLIDSHAVTKERYGFRVTGFSDSMFKALNPTAIICLYAHSSIIKTRIEKNSMGRPTVSDAEADMHNLLQANLAMQYAVQAGRPFYLLDGGLPEKELVEVALAKAKL